MIRRRSLFAALAAALLLCLAAASPSAAAVKQQTLALVNRGTAVLTPSVIANGDFAAPEIDDAFLDAGDGPDAAAARAAGRTLLGRPIGLRSLLNQPKPSRARTAALAAAGPLSLPIVEATPVTTENHHFSGFNGLNHHDQRFADGGNQFSVEPPDMCVAAGKGFVLQAVNDVVNVYDTAGNLLVATASLNKFFGYASAIVRGNPNVFGPSITDPTCYFDRDTQRFFLTVLTFDRVGTTSALAGTDHIDLAVSQSADPTQAWNIFSFDATDAAAPGCPCLGDFPHTGADANGFYVTTNEFQFAGPFNGAQIYAISKQALADGTASTVIQFTGLDYGTGDFVFAVMPATSPGRDQFDRRRGGTEWFLTALDAGSPFDNRIAVWALTNTSSLNGTPALGLSNAIVQSETYGDPLKSDQKVGSVPLADAINLGAFGSPHPVVEVEGQLDSSDSRVTTAVYTDGRLFGTGTTQVGVDGATRAGLAYFVVKPKIENKKTSGSIEKQGYVAVSNNNLTYSSIGLNDEGRGVITATLVGPDHFPTAAYVSFDKRRGTGRVHIASAGVGPQDGFTETHFFTDPRFRPRWGDYSATSTGGESIWLAQEYIAQTCTIDEYLADTSCGGTRSSLANWGTFVSRVKVDGDHD